MHECPECGSMCDCDGEDTVLGAPEDCMHECSIDDDDIDDEPDDHDWVNDDD